MGGQTAAQLQRRLDTEEFNDVFSDDVPDDTRNSLLRAQRDGDVGAEDIGSVSKRYKQLDDAEADQLDGLIQRQGKDGMEFAAELDGDTLSDLLSCGSRTVGGAAVYATSAGAGVSQSSGCTLDTDFLDAVADVNSKADNFDAQAFARRYNKLEGDNERRFRELAKNDDYGESWMRAVESPNIETDDIRTAESRVDEIERNGHEPIEFNTATELNSGKHPPHKPGSIVIDAEVESEDQFVRIYENNPSGEPRDEYLDGGFVMRRDDLIERNNPSEVLNDWALLPEWQEYNYVSRLSISDEFAKQNDIRVRISTVRRQVSDESDVVRSGGAKQYILRTNLEDSYDGVTWQRVNDLESYLNNN
ncbi:hypothetical protein EGH22_20145 [Halomicroarcula sp. F28]|uniref:hypothetical protein n=1 Tax=Haloarcula salinisoli TaxID=2487746 RepID=UPI001C73322E|nr:hypothetical protein [Halomicroarcula salinisoli]MBX0288646.1 hypothetical protein [Halomicroarcula salinisoli]